MPQRLINQNFIDLLLAMTAKEIKVRYKNALFGFFWIFLNPVLQMLILGLIFERIIKFSTNNYYFYLLSGLIPWNLFSYTTTKCTQAIVYERSLIQKAKFPSEVIVLSIVFSNSFHAFVSTLVFLPLLLVARAITPVGLLLIVPAFLWLIAIISGFSLLFSSLNVRFRDINFFVQAVMPLWFYLTPVMYALNFIPGQYRRLVYLNPMTGVIDFFHLALINKPIDDLFGFALSVMISFIIVVYSFIFYRISSRYFAEWL